MNNQEFKTRREIANVNSDEPVFFLFSIKVSKCSGGCNNINDPYAKMCVSDVIKNINDRVSNLMSRTNKISQMRWHVTYQCKCRLDESVCSNKQRWNKDKCRYECKELIDYRACYKEFIWNPSNCECECDKSCSVGEYLDYENLSEEKRLVDKFADKCNENVDKVKLVKITSAEHENVCNSSCKIYFVLIIFTISVGIGTYFVCYRYMNRNKETALSYDYVYQTTIY